MIDTKFIRNRRNIEHVFESFNTDNNFEFTKEGNHCIFDEYLGSHFGNVPSEVTNYFINFVSKKFTKDLPIISTIFEKSKDTHDTLSLKINFSKMHVSSIANSSDYWDWLKNICKNARDIQIDSLKNKSIEQIKRV